MGLTERQLLAVAVEAPPRDTCVVAGPGSGKTTVLVQYFVNLVKGGMDPLRILAITFTEKAANNMREKLAEAFRDRADIRGKLERAYVSTVDGFCTRLLKEYSIFAGIDPDFRVLDERDALRAQQECADEALNSLFQEQPERARALMRGLASNDTAKEILSVYDAIRASGIPIRDLPSFAAPPRPDIEAALAEARILRPAGLKFDQQAYLYEAQDWVKRIQAALPLGALETLRVLQSFNCNLSKLRRCDIFKTLKNDLIPELEYSLIAEHYSAERATILDLFARFDSLYRERKRQLTALDFADLEEYTVALLREHPDVRQRVQKQFDQILMDELQDTNELQARLLELLRPPDRFYAVGDINQSIYGFRHANPDVFRDYRDTVKRSGRRMVELIENFRSRPDILRAVAAVTDGTDGVVKRPLVAGKSFSEKQAASIELIAAATPELEGRWIAARILELEGSLELPEKRAEFRDFAVLVRNSEVLGDFTRAFDDCGIPYLVNRGKGFYESREIVDLLHLLRVIVNPRDEIGMAAVLRSPFVAVSDEALLRLKGLGNLGSAVEQLTTDALAAFLPEDAIQLAAFRDRLARWRAARDYTGIDRLLLRAIDECGYQPPGGPRGLANIEKFLAQARASGSRGTLAEFVDEVDLLRESNPREPDAPPEDSANAVKIMTVHTAKGLEFPVVFLAGMHKGVDTNLGAISFSPRIGLGANWRHPLGGKEKSDAFHHAVKEESSLREKQESHRLLYVAMTRAEQHLVLSFSGNRKKPQNWAGVVASGLGLVGILEQPCDRTVTFAAPDGAPVSVWVRCLDAPPTPVSPRQKAEAEAGSQVVDRPKLTDQHDGNANVTSVAMFADCPRRYYLSRYLGFEAKVQGIAESSSDLSASDFGLQVHALLAGVPVESPDEEAVMLAEQFRKTALARRAGAASSVEREFDFLMEVEDVVLRGQIDLWFEDRGKFVLVDYKTDRVTAVDAPGLAERYALQLRLYALALEKLTGRIPDEAYLCFLRPETLVPLDVRPSLFDSPEAVVREFREAQENMQFPLREGGHCVRCPHFGRLCPSRGVPNPALR